MLRSIDALRLQVPPGATREILFSTLADEEFTRSRRCFFLLRILRIPEIDVHIIEYVYHMQPFWTHLQADFTNKQMESWGWFGLFISFHAWTEKEVTAQRASLF